MAIGSISTTEKKQTSITPEKIMQIGFGFWASKVLLSAVELDVFTELAKGPDDMPALEERLGLHPRSSRDFLDALVALGFLQRNNGQYHNAPDTDRFLDKNKPSYVGGMLEMANHRLYGFWGDLTEALQTGQAQSEIKGGGESIFSTLYEDPQRLREFLSAMSGVSHATNCTIARQFPWQDVESFVDVGTAQGDLAVQVALAHPHLSGIGFDLPVVEPVFADYAAQHDLTRQLSFVGGDFFKEPLPRADVVMFGHILHDWNLQEKMHLLAKAYDALPKGGAVLIYDAIIDDSRSQNAFGLMLSLNMLIETPGGFDYTGADCMGWLKEVGFTETRVEHLVGPDSMVIGIK
jgi:hypothetical protein